jgi:hypothetical protein
MHDSDNITDEVVKLAPPVGVGALSVMGVPLSDWVYIITIVYLFVQIGCTLYKTFRNRKDDA